MSVGSCTRTNDIGGPGEIPPYIFVNYAGRIAVTGEIEFSLCEVTGDGKEHGDVGAVCESCVWCGYTFIVILGTKEALGSSGTRSFEYGTLGMVSSVQHF